MPQFHVSGVGDEFIAFERYVHVLIDCEAPYSSLNPRVEIAALQAQTPAQFGGPRINVEFTMDPDDDSQYVDGRYLLEGENITISIRGTWTIKNAKQRFAVKNNRNSAAAPSSRASILVAGAGKEWNATSPGVTHGWGGWFATGDAPANAGKPMWTNGFYDLNAGYLPNKALIDVQCADYPGLFSNIENDAAVTAADNVVVSSGLSIDIRHLNATLSAAGSLAAGAGLLGGQYFARGSTYHHNGARTNDDHVVCVISDCHITNVSPQEDGGSIVGKYAATKGGALIIHGCSAQGGSLTQPKTGGLVGSHAASHDVTGYGAGTVVISQSGFAGDITADYCGGLVGPNWGAGDGTVARGNVFVLGSYFRGDITNDADYSAGVLGPQSVTASWPTSQDATEKCRVVISNSYLVGEMAAGNMTGGAGQTPIRTAVGIFSTGEINITNLYTPMSRAGSTSISQRQSNPTSGDGKKASGDAFSYYGSESIYSTAQPITGGAFDANGSIAIANTDGNSLGYFLYNSSLSAEGYNTLNAPSDASADVSRASIHVWKALHTPLLYNKGDAVIRASLVEVTALTATSGYQSPHASFYVWGDSIFPKPTAHVTKISATSTNKTITKAMFDNMVYPIVVGANTAIEITESFTLTYARQKFVLTGDGASINGYGHVHVVQLPTGANVDAWSGFIENGWSWWGTSSDWSNSQNTSEIGWGGKGYSCTISNIGISASSDSVLLNGGAWLLASNFAQETTGVTLIEKCHSTGDINASTDAGGLAGAELASGMTVGKLTMDTCYTTGLNTSLGGGNLIGSYCGVYGGGTSSSTAGRLVITNCFTTGDVVAAEAGGMLGRRFGAGSAGGCISLTYCFSQGRVSGHYAAGLFGRGPGWETLSAAGTTASATWATKRIISLTGVYTSGTLLHEPADNVETWPASIAVDAANITVKFRCCFFPNAGGYADTLPVDSFGLSAAAGAKVVDLWPVWAYDGNGPSAVWTFQDNTSIGWSSWGNHPVDVDLTVPAFGLKFVEYGTAGRVWNQPDPLTTTNWTREGAAVLDLVDVATNPTVSSASGSISRKTAGATWWLGNNGPWVTNGFGPWHLSAFPASQRMQAAIYIPSSSASARGRISATRVLASAAGTALDLRSLALTQYVADKQASFSGLGDS